MSNLLASMGQSVGSTLSSLGQNVQSAAGGNVMPLVGDIMPKQITGLLDSIATKSDPTKDPYKPDQPVAYNTDGSLKAPEPNQYAGLLSAISAPPEQKLDLIEKQPPAAMRPVVRTIPTSQVDPSAKLRRQAFGAYL